MNCLTLSARLSKNEGSCSGSRRGGAFRCVLRGNAYRSQGHGCREKRKSGKKIYITGKGRCNLTNLCTPREFLDNVVRNPKFLYSAIYGFTPEDTVDFFEKNGLKLKTERGNRVFPVSDKASDVTKTLRAAAEKAGAEFRFNMSVEKLTQKTEKFAERR